MMKAQITAILAGMPQQYTAYAKVAREMPDNIKPSDNVPRRLGKNANQNEVHVAGAISSSCLNSGVPVIEGTPSQVGDSDENGEDGEIAMPDRYGDETVDPRVTEAALKIARLEGGTAQTANMVDGMDIDDAQEASIQEALDHQLRQG